MKMPVLLLLLALCLCNSHAQTDSTLLQLQNLPKKYFTTVEKKIDKYSSRISGKTEKTLVKLSRWENKIHTLLLKVNPGTASMLFAPGQITFGELLKKYREGKTITEGYKASYNHYLDELTTQLKYIEDKKELLDKKYLQPIAQSKKKINKLQQDIENTEALQQVIKERKKQLMQEAMKYLGKTKYLQKINKESFYFFETAKNFREILSDKKKTEETALTILKKIPAFGKFVRENSMLSSLFGSPVASGSPSGAASLAGLQTRASVNALIQNQIASGGAMAIQQVQQNVQEAQAELTKLKDKILKAGGTSSDMEIPDFKIREVKTKTFKQRLEFGTNFQFEKNNSYLPGSATIGLSAGYRLGNKFLVGLGASYRIGLGSINKIKITHEAVGIRSFVDWKMKKQFYITGGYEMNYNQRFKNLSALSNSFGNAGIASPLQRSALIGLSKKISLKTKLIKGTTLQLLYNMLYKTHAVPAKPVVFRVGYNF